MVEALETLCVVAWSGGFILGVVALLLTSFTKLDRRWLQAGRVGFLVGFLGMALCVLLVVLGIEP